MILIVDKNEETTNIEVIKLLKKNFSDVHISNIKDGDINIPLDDGGLLVIERKTPLDFLRSLRDGEIFEQVERMSKYSYSAVVITGRIDLDKDYIGVDGKYEDYEGKKFKWTSASIDNLMTVIQWSGCALKFCSPKFYPVEIARLYQVANKPEERTHLVKRRIVTFPPIDERIEFIGQLPGVGLKLAESLLCFAGIMDSNADDLGYGTLAGALSWLSILVQIDKDSRPEGWGAKKILTFRKFMGLASNEYIAINSEIQEMVDDDNTNTLSGSD